MCPRPRTHTSLPRMSAPSLFFKPMHRVESESLFYRAQNHAVNGFYSNFIRAINKIDNLNCVEGATLLEVVLEKKRWDMACALFRKGLSPNCVGHGGATPIWCTFGYERRIFLIKHGASVPKWFLVYPEIKNYIYRQWLPQNHQTWPNALQAQIQTILVIARGKRKTTLSTIPMDVLLRILQVVAAEHIVLE